MELFNFLFNINGELLDFYVYIRPYFSRFTMHLCYSIYEYNKWPLDL
jgi:hypothetical protein